MVQEILQTEGCPNGRTTIRVPPDDIDGALAKIEPELSRALNDNACVTVDYTGGTKSMTSAMVLAATSHESVRLQFMAGSRIDLTHVKEGTEKPVEIPTELIGLSQTFGIVRKFVGHRNYGAALSVLREIDRTFARMKRKVPSAWRKSAGEWRKWVAIFDYWDRFDHAAAWDKLRNGLDCGAPHATWFEKEGKALFARLERLAVTRSTPSNELLEDLWLNAERRARLGLYDDAVARLYRLMEAAVQTRLREEHEIRTDNVPLDRLPDGLRKKSLRLGQPNTVKLALSDAADLLAHLDPTDELPRILKKGNPNWQGKRNRSILAHGFQPLGENDWKQARSWFEQRSGVLWKDRLNRPLSEQLPDRLPIF